MPNCAYATGRSDNASRSQHFMIYSQDFSPRGLDRITFVLRVPRTREAHSHTYPSANPEATRQRQQLHLLDVYLAPSERPNLTARDSARTALTRSCPSKLARTVRSDGRARSTSGTGAEGGGGRSAGRAIVTSTSFFFFFFFFDVLSRARTPILVSTLRRRLAALAGWLPAISVLPGYPDSRPQLQMAPSGSIERPVQGYTCSTPGAPWPGGGGVARPAGNIIKPEVQERAERCCHTLRHDTARTPKSHPPHT
ncbi:hypothetical protein BC628DRAFT_994387 [Trametes gibbosa]|nr:hypothetical protein BC628DRAFT_994387 [Trametes gibbosa]